MTAKIIDGKKIAFELVESLKPRVVALKEKGIQPCLAVVLVGENSASKLYVSKKQKSCELLGIKSLLIEKPENVSEKEILQEIEKLNSDSAVHGVLVQLPLPEEIDYVKVIEAIDPKKDVDGFTSKNMGKLVLGKEKLASCTPKGVIKLIESTGKKLGGVEVCIIGHGIAVGLPLSIMLLNRNATVTVCDKYTQFLGQKSSQCDILVSCAGVPNLLRAKMVKEGAIVIDVGINHVNGKLCGDAAFDEVKEKASFITPVPGGVGPMTVACLMENTIIVAEAEK